MEFTKTLAFQIPEELFNRIKDHLEREKQRTGRKLSQKDFVIGLIERALISICSAGVIASSAKTRPRGCILIPSSGQSRNISPGWWMCGWMLALPQWGMSAL